MFGDSSPRMLGSVQFEIVSACTGVPLWAPLTTPVRRCLFVRGAHEVTPIQVKLNHHRTLSRFHFVARFG